MLSQTGHVPLLLSSHGWTLHSTTNIIIRELHNKERIPKETVAMRHFNDIKFARDLRKRLLRCAEDADHSQAGSLGMTDWG